MIFVNNYLIEQTNLAVITPSSGKKLHVWVVIADTGSNFSLEFKTSQKIVKNIPTIGTGDVEFIGAIDEVLSLDCGVNTSIGIMYEEID